MSHRLLPLVDLVSVAYSSVSELVTSDHLPLDAYVRNFWPGIPFESSVLDNSARQQMLVFGTLSSSEVEEGYRCHV